MTEVLKNPLGQTAEEWLAEAFEFEYCAECGLDEDKHIAIMFMGNWFALCDPSLPTGQVHLSDIRLKNNAGMSFPVCAADEDLLDLDKSRWPQTNAMKEVTCPNCPDAAVRRYPWAYARGDSRVGSA